MVDTDDHFDDYTISPCGRSEAMELAIRAGVIAHIVVCVLCLTAMTMLEGGPGILLGLGLVALLACAVPFVVLPASAVIGFLTHLAFHRTQVSVPLMARVLVILFEASILGWIVILLIASR